MSNFRSRLQGQSLSLDRPPQAISKEGRFGGAAVNLPADNNETDLAQYALLLKDHSLGRAGCCAISTSKP
jgi:hypothetical protein